MILKTGLQVYFLLQLAILFSLLTVTVIASSANSLFRAVRWFFEPVVRTEDHYA